MMTLNAVTFLANVNQQRKNRVNSNTALNQTDLASVQRKLNAVQNTYERANAPTVVDSVALLAQVLERTNASVQALSASIFKR